MAQTYFLQGDAVFMGDDCYRLTTTLTNQNGAVWYAEQIDLNDPFDLEFFMNFGNLDANGADGICFVLQTVGTNALGQSGGGLGFLGFSPAFAVEFDTWQNNKYADPVYDHIGMISNGDVSHISGNAIAGPVQASAFDMNIEDGDDHIVRIVWEPQEQIVQVYFDCEFRLSGAVDLINDIFSGQSLVYWGFTAGTGGSFNNQTVCLQENILSTSPDVLVCEGATIELSAAGDPAGTFEWSPTDYLDDPSSQNPNCTPEQDITYTVTYTDLCGQTQEAYISVSVETLTVDISGPTEINCINSVATLNTSTNFGLPNVYTWSTEDGNFTTGINAPSVVINEGGTYTVSLVHNQQCEATAEITITADFDEPLISLTAEDEITCVQNEVVVSSDTNVPDANYTWSTNNGQISGPSNTSDVTVISGGTYSLNITDPSNGCDSDLSIVVNENLEFPAIVVGEADTLSCRTPVVQILGTTVVPEGSALVWSNVDGGLTTGWGSAEPSVNLEGWYILSVTHPTSGCVSHDSVYVHSDGEVELDLSSLMFPNIFTPNNDGINDRFRPILMSDPQFSLMGLFTRYDLRIYNRWGALVIDTEGQALAWDGRDESGSLYSEGTYFYIIDFDILCGPSPDQPLTGTFQLAR